METTVRKSLGQKILAVCTVVLLTVTLATLTGCDGFSGASGATSSASDDTYVGTWKATSAELLGLQVGIAEVIAGSFEMEIKADGTAELRPLGQAIPCVWKVSGNKITLSGGAIADLISGGNSAAISATMENDKLVLDDYTGTGARILFEKQA